MTMQYLGSSVNGMIMKMEEKRGKRSPVALAGLGILAHHLFLWGVLRWLAWSVIKVMADHDIHDNDNADENED